MKKLLSFILSMTVVFSAFSFTDMSLVFTSAEQVLTGDINFDGAIDAKDVLLFQKYQLNTNIMIDEIKADCDGDGEINTKDLLRLRKYLAKLGDLAYVEQTVKSGWNTIANFESDTVNKKPTSIPVVMKNADMKVVSKTSTLNELSQKSLNITAYGSYDNPERADEPCTIDISSADLTKATNMRFSINIADNSDVEAYDYNIGLKIGADMYYYKITPISYSETGYFYLVGKTFSKYSGKPRTYMNDEPEKLEITMDNVKYISQLCFWTESSRGLDDYGNLKATPISIDDIQFYVGERGYNSATEDENLPKDTIVNDGTKKYVAISFDDGPKSYNSGHYMDYYLDLAEKYNAKFTFFLVGKEFGNDDVDVLKRAVDLGSELGNHTWNHWSLKNKTLEQVGEETGQVDDWLQEKVGVTTKLIRPPYLDKDAAMLASLEQLNLPAIGGYCPNDYNETSVDYKEAYYRLHLKDGAISLTHEWIITNVETLDRIMDRMSKEGYEFVTISELFKIKGVTPSFDGLYSDIK